MVPDRQNRLPRTHQTASEPADRGVSDDLRDSEQRCGGHDWTERQREREGEVGQFQFSVFLSCLSRSFCSWLTSYLQWDERRVFYCTPQTLDNDLKKGSVDPRDIVLAVFGALLVHRTCSNNRSSKC